MLMNGISFSLGIRTDYFAALPVGASKTELRLYFTRDRIID